MTKYLENDICEFEPLFKIDYSKKINILTTCFFKMGKHYKNFETYVRGLKKLINMLNRQNEYVLRIFIDDNIRKDRTIMDVLESSRKVQPVLFKCAKYMDGNYHIDVFGALVRLFPAFDFKNNDANNVICIDVDLNNDDIETLRKFLYYKTDHKQIIGKGMISALFMLRLRPHYFCGLIGFFNKKYNTKIITDFIKKAPTIIDKGVYGKREKPFGYGTDELFLNQYFIYAKDYTADVELGSMYEYDINWFLYHYKEDMLKENPNITRDYLTYIVDGLYKNNMTTEELFDLVDKKVYQVDPTDPDKIKLTTNYYKLLKVLVNEKKKWFDKEVMKMIDKHYYGIIQSLSIVFFDRDNMHIYKVVNIGSKILK